MHTASHLVNASGQTQPLESLAGQRVAVFCAIGNPAGFQHTLSTTGCQITTWREFPDHYTYTPADLTTVANAATTSDAQLVLCTQKDLVKVRQDNLGDLPLWAIAIEMRFLRGQEALEQMLQRVARRE